MGYEHGFKALYTNFKLIIVRYEKGSLRFGGSQICFGRRCDVWIELLVKTREFGKLA